MNLSFFSLKHDADLTFVRAARGIGHEFVKQLIAAGHTVIATVRSSSPTLSSLANSSDGKLIVLICDLASAESVSSFGQQLARQVSHIDVLINNAGTQPSAGSEHIAAALSLLSQ